jgi:carbonic anhydrase
MSSAAANLAELKAGHDRFLQGASRHPHASPSRLKEIVPAQHPIAMVLSCSDSRVPVELMFDVGFGDLYVVRNAGNVSTPGSVASIEYGLEGLDIPLLVVLGHEGCGAVTAACTPQEHLSPCLFDLVSHIRSGLQTDGVDHAVLPEAFRLNPQRAADQLIASSELIRERVQSGRLVIEVGCYGLADAAVEWFGSAKA